MRNRAEIMRDAETIYDFMAETDTSPMKADIILAAGCHDLRVPDHAAELFLRGTAPLIVCTGGLGKMTDGLWDTPEGDMFAARCRALGVPEENLIVERHAANTGENFSLSRELLVAMGLFPRTGVIVSKPYMAMRAKAAAAVRWPEVSWSSRVPPIPFKEYCDGDEAFDAEIELMTGDLQRLKVYAERGWQAPVTVPGPVWAAFERLTEDGYDRYVIR